MKPTRATTSEPAFVLLETILALALFVSVAAAMAVALHQLAASSMNARRESMLLRRMESEFAEAAHRTVFIAGTECVGPDAFGISVTTKVEHVKEVSQQGETLEGVFRLRVTAAMPDTRGGLLRREMETCVIRLETIPPKTNAGSPGQPVSTLDPTADP